MGKEKAQKVTKKKDEGKKSKKAAKSASKESALSAQRVVESESEQEAKVAKAEKKTKKSEAKSPKKTKAAAAPPPPPPKAPTPSESSDEEETDSDEEMPDAPIVPRKPESIPPKINGIKRKAENESSLRESTKLEAKRVKTAAAQEDAKDSSDEEETDSESSEEVEAERVSTIAPKPPAATAKAKLTKPATPVQAEDKDSDSSDESSDEQETDSEEENKRDEGNAAAHKPGAAMARTEAVPVKPYKPPPGYSASSIAKSMLPAGPMTGKQVWTITTPSNVPITSIKELALDSTHTGLPVLEHNGTSYILSEDRGVESDTAVIPTAHGYDPAPQRIAMKLVLQRKVDLPNLSAKRADTSTGSKAAANIARPAVSTARPQPKGMRMRYKPPGFGAGDPGLGSDTDEEASRPSKKDKSLQFPKALGAHGASDKPDAETPKVKKSNKKKEKIEDVDMVNGHEPAPPSELRLSKSVSKESVERASSKDGLSKEERRKRREEKRAKKEARIKSTT
ncbi:uncharacterized protein MYCFIDRAFT_200117 [Pseudocercospora fijiensis CIRAD86]|uniref:Uncharacterized protein n=1 Tax=Pseudocercospora fijiensis (strain CIRAD86) TaxID=383855 RepID=M3AKF9_PSEFD|nr:uncharacterized protein MYCFIDRAFT_200117 [Pseudocercospora fijiensis CIRAD86]EME77648.1 hypothetical protein MYCFIDRAFT_200117 [Pseudocercospora fijiensis CIRAD86]